MAEGEERWRKYIDPDGVARIPDDEFRGLLARFEEVQRRYEELEDDYALRLSHLMAEEHHSQEQRERAERAESERDRWHAAHDNAERLYLIAREAEDELRADFERVQESLSEIAGWAVGTKPSEIAAEALAEARERGDRGKAIWSCEIGEVDRATLPGGADAPMRRAVEAVYRELTGRDPDFHASGWGRERGEQ